MTTETAAGQENIAEVVQKEVERTIQRSVRGIDVLLNRDEPDVGMTPKDVIYSRGTLRLYHYRPQSDEVYRIPVVLVMSLVSKPYILDLTPGVSFVEFLLKQGFDVFMIDWGVPRPAPSLLPPTLGLQARGSCRPPDGRPGDAAHDRATPGRHRRPRSSRLPTGLAPS